MLYCSSSNLSDNQFLYIDVGVLVPLCIFQSWTGAYHKLTSVMPQDSLFNAPVIISVLGIAAIQLFFQLYMFLTVKSDLNYDDWYKVCETIEDVDEDDPPCSLNTVLYIFTIM